VTAPLLLERCPWPLVGVVWRPLWQWPERYVGAFLKSGCVARSRLREGPAALVVWQCTKDSEPYPQVPLGWGLATCKHRLWAQSSIVEQKSGPRPCHRRRGLPLGQCGDVAGFFQTRTMVAAAHVKRTCEILRWVAAFYRVEKKFRDEAPVRLYLPDEVWLRCSRAELLIRKAV
jgi:hypothetical protein